MASETFYKSSISNFDKSMTRKKSRDAYIVVYFSEDIELFSLPCECLNLTTLTFYGICDGLAQHVDALSLMETNLNGLINKVVS